MGRGCSRRSHLGALSRASLTATERADQFRSDQTDEMKRPITCPLPTVPSSRRNDRTMVLNSEVTASTTHPGTVCEATLHTRAFHSAPLTVKPNHASQTNRFQSFKKMGYNNSLAKRRKPYFATLRRPEHPPPHRERRNQPRWTTMYSTFQLTHHQTHLRPSISRDARRWRKRNRKRRTWDDATPFLFCVWLRLFSARALAACRHHLTD